MQNLRVAIELAISDPSHLERGVPEAAAHEQPVEVREAQAKIASVTSGLRSFELNPKGADNKPLLSGLAHFDHLVKMARRCVPMGVNLVPSPALNVEYSKEQQRIINPTPMDYSMHEIAKHAHGADAQQAAFILPALVNSTLVYSTLPTMHGRPSPSASSTTSATSALTVASPTTASVLGALRTP